MADQTGDSGTGTNPGGMPQGDSSQQAPQRGQTASFSFTTPRQPQARAPQQQAPRSNTKAQGPEAAKAQKVEIEGLDPKALKELSAALKDLTGFNTKHSASVKDMTAAVQDLGRHLQALNGNGDLGARRFKILQETVCSLVDDLDDVQDQYSTLIRLQRQIQAAPDLLMGKNKTEGLRVLRQMIDATKTLQKSHELDAKTLNQLDKNLKVLEKTYQSVEKAKEDAFDREAVDEITEALREANESAARLKKNFAETSTTGISRGVKRLKNDMGDAFDNPLKTFMEAKGLDKIAAKFKTAFGRDARRDRVEARQRDSQNWKQWKTDRVAYKEDQAKRAGAKLNAQVAVHKTPKFTAGARSTKSVSVAGLALRPPVQPKAPTPSPAPTPTAAAAGGTLNFANVTIQSATIEKLAGDLLGKAAAGGQIPGGAEDEGEETRIPRKEKKQNQKGPAKSKRQLRRENAAAKLAEKKAAEAPAPVADAVADAVEAAPRGPLKLRDFAKSGTKLKWRGAGRAAARTAANGLQAAAGGEMGSAAIGGAGRLAGGGLMRGLGAGLGRVAGMAAAPLAIAGALLAVRDKIAAENKELNEALAGGGINSGGVDFDTVRKSLLSTGISNAASRGIGKKENMEVMQALMAGGQGLGFLSSGGGTNLENALMTRQEAVAGRDQFQGGGFIGVLSSIARGATLGGTADADDTNAQRRKRDASGTLGAVMKNANFYGKNVGMDRSQSVKLTMDLLEKYQLTTEQTGDFFLKIDKAMKTAQISSAKYLEVVESVNSGFEEFHNTLRLTSHMLELVGRNSRFTGDRMKNMVGEMVKGPQQDIAHAAFLAQRTMGADKGIRDNRIQMFEDMASSAFADLVEQSKNFGEFFDARNGVQKNDKNEITGITNLEQFEARLAELARTDGVKDNPTLKAIQMQLDKTLSSNSFGKAMASALKKGDFIGAASIQENYGKTPEGAFVANMNLMEFIAKESGVKLTDLMSRDTDVKGAAMEKSSTLRALLAKEMNMPMEELTKKIDAMGNIRSQAIDFISEKVSRFDAAGNAPTDGSVSGTQTEALAKLARQLQAQGVEGLQGQDLTDNKAAIVALQKMAKDKSGNRLVSVLNDNQRFLSELPGSLKSLRDEMDRDKEAKEGKRKADEVTAATRTSADIFADSFSYLFDKLIASLSNLGKILNPGNWLKWSRGENLTGEDAASAKEVAKGSGIRQELTAFLDPLKGNQSKLGPAEKQMYDTLRTMTTKTGAFTTEEATQLNEALSGLTKYLQTGENAKTFGLKKEDIEAAKGRVYAAGEDAVKRSGTNTEAEVEAARQRVKEAAKMGKGAADISLAGTVGLDALTQKLYDGDNGKVRREHQAALDDRLRKAHAQGNNNDFQTRQLYAADFLVNNTFLKGLKKDPAAADENNAIISQRLQDETMQRYFGKGDKGVYSFKAGSDQDTVMGELLKYAQSQGLLAGATRTVGANGQVVYNITNNNNVDATTALKVQRAPAGKTSETASTTKPPTVPVP